MKRKRALILKFGQIGDIVMAIPAVRELYEQGCEIDWVCGQAAHPLLEAYSWIRVIPVNDQAIFFGSLPIKFSNVFALWRQVVFRKYDVCATLYYDRRFHLLASPILARRKVSLSRKWRERVLLSARHHTDEYLRILLANEDGCRESSTRGIRPDQLPPSPWKEPPATRRVAIVPGGTSNVLGDQVLRRWPIGLYVKLAAAMIDRGWEIVLLGGPADNWVVSHFDHLQVINCVGAFSLPEVVSACDACDAVISHDTGPLHLAGLSQACLVGIFGPTDPSTFVPRRPFVVGIWGGQGFACRPCYDGLAFAPCRFNGCMHQVSVDLVLREVDQLLEARLQGLPAPWRIVTPEPSSFPAERPLIQLKAASF